MVSRVNSVGLAGLEGFAVEVEADIHRAEKLEIDERWARRLHGRALDSLTLESPPFPVL